MKKRWLKNPHCFWCGIETVWHENNLGKREANEATIDHIRTKWRDARKEANYDKWEPGIRVLSCHKCNHERGALETAWIQSLKPTVFRDRGNSESCKSSGLSLMQAQGDLATAIMRFIETGGTLNGEEKRVRIVLRFVEKLREEYDKKRADSTAD